MWACQETAQHEHAGQSGVDCAAAHRRSDLYGQSDSCLHPIFLCPGFLGPSKDDASFDPQGYLYQYWGEAMSLGTPESPVRGVWPGGLSSVHDRACEVHAGCFSSLPLSFPRPFSPCLKGFPSDVCL
jgi:hypothetical protein